MRIMCVQNTYIDKTVMVKGATDFEAFEVSRGRRQLGLKMRELIKSGARPIKGTFNWEYMAHVEYYNAVVHRFTCYVDAPFRVLLRARRLGVEIPRGGRRQWVRAMRELLDEGIITDKVRGWAKACRWAKDKRRVD